MSNPANATPFDISLGLEDTHVLVTGGCGLIGRVVVQAFLAAGSKVTVLDIHSTSPFDNTQNPKVSYFQADITKDIDAAFARAEQTFGPVECCIALASLDLSVLTQSESICDMDPAEWRRVMDVNVNGTFLTARRWLQGIRKASASGETSNVRLKNVGLVIMGSESGRFGVRTQPAYAAGKSAVQGGLMLSLAQDAPRIFPRARVNAVAPGAVDTARFKEETARYGEAWRWAECEATVGLAKAVPVEDVARSILFLASERFSGSVHGQLLPVDAGKMGTVCWTREELAERRGGRREG